MVSAQDVAALTKGTQFGATVLVGLVIGTKFVFAFVQSAISGGTVHLCLNTNVVGAPFSSTLSKGTQSGTASLKTVCVGEVGAPLVWAFAQYA
jgi:hypothetical protein